VLTKHAFMLDSMVLVLLLVMNFAGPINSLVAPSLFPPPSWAPNWDLLASTTIQPSGDSYFMPNHTWGLISLDWSVAKSVWMRHGRNRTNCEAVSVEGCRRLKAAGKASRCFIYHNMELALEWEETQRKVMYDPSTADYFLQYTDGMGNKNGTIYAENIEEGDQFFWDYTNPKAAAYVISSILRSVDDPAVDGTFTDDVNGFPQEHESATARINMSHQQLAALQAATRVTHAKLVGELVKAGKYNWQAFGVGDGAGVTCPSDPKGCSAFMQTGCDPEMQSRPMMMDAAHADNQTVAAFLITRPPIGFIGWGWESGDSKWPSSDVFLLKPGEPQGLCKQEQPGIYSRQWSKGKVVLNCNEWTASLPFSHIDQPSGGRVKSVSADVLVE